ncbi:MAG TPA: carboxypeptidase-like regulatory domain-containing protein [Edaphobacter sp.]
MRGPSKHSGFRPTSRHRWWSIFACLTLYLTLHLPAHAQQQSTPPPGTQLPSAPIPQSTLGSINGTVTDPDGAILAGATIILSRDSQPASEAPQQDRQTTSGADGRFSFPNLTPGPYKLTTSAPRFSSLQTPILLHPGENYEASDISLPAASLAIDMQVTASQQDVAQAQIQVEEKQRIFGAIPNFYVSYVPNPVPLTSKQKFELAWKTLIDPITFTATGFIAGIEQAQDDFGGYGQGTQGYAKRYAAAYGNAIVGTAIGNAILPSILKQDPRYFYKGTGTTRSRALYAIANSVMCKGDNGHWQPNNSAIAGGAAAGGISNFYYPSADRSGTTLTLENTALGIAGSAIQNLFQEFLVRKLTPHLPEYKTQSGN